MKPSSPTSSASPVIVALDFASRDEAFSLVESLGASANFYKVGLQLLTEVGPQMVRDLIRRGKFVFLDLKLHEIPSSVAAAVNAAGKLGVSGDRTFKRPILQLSPRLAKCWPSECAP
jgi:orotidine-5'-phosphate decarboxylase